MAVSVRTTHARSRAFSLVELVLVIVILGTIGAIAVPRLSQAGASAREAALVANLSVVTRAVELYKAEHGGKPPTSSAQLTMYTNAGGATSATPGPSHPFGPYLYRLPELTMGTHRGKRDITTTGTPGTAPDAGWWIDSMTGEVRANLPDSDLGSNGTPLNELRPGKPVD